MKEDKEESPFPTIVKNALDRFYNGPEQPRDIPKLHKKLSRRIRLEMQAYQLKSNLESMRIRNDQLVGEIRDMEHEIDFLKADNAVLRSLVRKLRK